MPRTSRGFTLLELLVVIAIAGVLTGIAIPSFRSFFVNAQRRDAATSFYAALNRTRSEAIAHNASVSICARDVANLTTPTCATGSGNWQNGWIVYANATPGIALLVHEPIADGFTLGTGISSPQTFDLAGRVAAALNFQLCNGSAGTDGRSISVSRSGRVSLTKVTCS